jgi:hypothetical protein
MSSTRFCRTLTFPPAKSLLISSCRSPSLRCPIELTTSSTPSFGAGASTTVSSLSARVVRTRGGGGALHEGWGLLGGVFGRFGFFGQFRDMCPCCLQKKHRPSAMSRLFSSSLRGFRVLMVSTSIAFGSQEEEPPPCPHCPKRRCHWFLVPKLPWFPICGRKERMAFLVRYLHTSSWAACCHCGIVSGQTSRFMIMLSVPGRNPERKASIIPVLLNSQPAFEARELNAVM